MVPGLLAVAVILTGTVIGTTVSEPSSATAIVGLASVVWDDEATESLPGPTVFVAFTLKVYGVLAANPVQLYVVLFAPAAQTAPEGVEVTV